MFCTKPLFIAYLGQMQKKPINLVLADDDRDDRDFFKEVVDCLPLAIELTTAKDGVELLDLLSTKKRELPDVLFMDLNMPRKNGFECLAEIKSNAKLRQVPVVIFSTSSEVEKINQLYCNGAHFYICKPTEFTKLKNVVNQALSYIIPVDISPKDRENFELTSS